MRPEVLAEEAQLCRTRAAMFRGRPEQPFLLKLATAFEVLALSSLGDHEKSH
jgi:hypothetical protein